MAANKELKMKDGQANNGQSMDNDSGKGHQSSMNASDERRNIRKEVCGEHHEKYSKELTVEVEVAGTEKISMMDLLRGVKKECGEVVGCRVRGERSYELTMKDDMAKSKLMDGVRVKGAMVHARDIVNNEMVVSFINLPVYLEDQKIFAKLEEWGVKPLSAIKRRVWPGTDILDGTRFLKVRFTDEVRSLPYSTRFETLRGTEYFRVIHDRQVRVCRLCIKTGHLFRECPEFKCFSCGKVGHYARECGEQTERVIEEEGEQSEDDERREDDQTEKQSTVSEDDMEVTKDGRESGNGQDGAVRGQRAGTAGEEADDGERREEEEEEEEKQDEQDEEEEEYEEDVKLLGTKQEKKVEQQAVPQRKESKIPQRMQTTLQKLTVKRKAERDKDRIELIKEQRSGT